MCLRKNSAEETKWTAFEFAISPAHATKGINKSLSVVMRFLVFVLETQM